MNTLNFFLSNEIISALGWTFINVLWQGFLMAFLLGLFFKLFKNHSSHIRYFIALTSLLLIVVISILNFVRYYEPANYINENTELTKSQASTLITNTNNLFLGNEVSESVKSSFLSLIHNIDQYFPILVNIWLVGIIVFILKFIFGLLYTQRLKNRNIQYVSEKWNKKFSTLEKKLSLDKRIKYLESQLLKIPVVLGYLKPVIIIPAGMLTGIPENQIEAIIAHELAHIKRHDYLVNILQAIIEIIFFFHPAVWYISSLVRNERENCCDDIALTVCDGSLTYAKALVSVQELYPGKVYSAVAFSGQRKQLLNRIKRMIMKPEMKSNLNDKIIASLIVIIGIVILTVSANFRAESSEPSAMVNNDSNYFPLINPVTNTAKIINPKIVQETKNFLNDTSKVVKKKKHVDRDGYIDIENNTVTKKFKDTDGTKKEMKFTLKNGEIVELYIDGKKIPEKEFKKYQPEIDRTIEELKDAKADIKEAIKEIEEIDFEKIQKDVQEAMKNVHIDMSEIQKELARAAEEVKQIDVERIMKEVEFNIQKINSKEYEKQMIELHKSIEDIQHIDTEEFRQHMEMARKQMENIDLDKIRAEIEKSREHMDKEIDIEAIQKEMLKAQKEIAKIDMDKIRMEVEENIKQVDREKIVKDMEKELEKLEGLELEKK